MKRFNSFTMKYKRPNYNSPTRSRHGNIQSLGTTLEKLIDTYKLKAKMNESSIVTSWESVMGTVIAKRTEKVFIRDKELYVKVNSAPLRRELEVSRAKIIALLNTELGEAFLTNVHIF